MTDLGYHFWGQKLTRKDWFLFMAELAPIQVHSDTLIYGGEVVKQNK